MKKSIKVLFLSAWYPTPDDAMDGLFVKKHAEAVGRFCDVSVLFAYPDKTAKRFEIKTSSFAAYDEITVAYPVFGKGFVAKISKFIHFFIAYFIAYRHMRKKGFKPDIVHVNVLTRMALIAYIIKIFTRKPYVVLEHWSRYFPENSDSYSGFLRQLLTKFVVKRAAAIMPVSHYLKQAMMSKGLVNQNYVVVNNVVDDFFSCEKTVDPDNNKKQLLHVSCFVEKTKNIFGILRSIKKVSLKRNDFELNIVGSGPDFERTRAYSHELGLSDCVRFLGEKMPEEVAGMLKKTDFFILFSLYENMPVVLSESLVSGVPVVSSSVGGIPEMINKTNGKLVPVADEDALAEAIEWMLDHYQEYDSKEMSRVAIQRFSYDAVGAYIAQVYETCLKKNK